MHNSVVRAIEEDEMMQLIGRDREVFLEALLTPPEPSASLRAAAKRHKHCRHRASATTKIAIFGYS